MYTPIIQNNQGNHSFVGCFTWSYWGQSQDMVIANTNTQYSDFVKNSEHGPGAPTE